MKKYFGWLLAALTSFSLASAYAAVTKPVAKAEVEEEIAAEEALPAVDTEDQVATVVVDEEESESNN